MNANAQDDGRKQKVCYYCGIEGHVAKDCTNEKSTREKKLPWPQSRRIGTGFTQLSRAVVKDWSSEELVMVNELVRLTELLIDAKLNVVRASKEIELRTAPEKKKIVFWCRATNEKAEHEFQPVNNSVDETKSRMMLWKGDIIVVNRLMETQMDSLLSLVEKTASAKVAPVVSRVLKTNSASVKKVLEKMRPKPVMVLPNDAGADSTETGIEVTVVARIHAMAEFLEKLYAEAERITHKTVVDGVTQVIEKHARKEAEGRKVNVETAAKEKEKDKEKEKPRTEMLTAAQLKELVAAETVKRNGILSGAKAALDPLLL